jgi:hypothetical protein
MMGGIRFAREIESSTLLVGWLGSVHGASISCDAFLAVMVRFFGELIGFEPAHFLGFWGALGFYRSRLETHFATDGSDAVFSWDKS